MEFKDFRFVYVDIDYLRALNAQDKEVLFAENSNYEEKPHLGVLISNNGFQYVIPLTSAKEKHKKWKDVTPTNYRIYETIDTRTTRIDKYDIIVDENDYNKLREMGVSTNEYRYFKKRILSVLEIKKMFPIPESKYTEIDLSTILTDIKAEQRRVLMQKEYFFCRRYMGSIKEKARNIYEKQISTGTVLPFHCNYKKLESIASLYE